MDLLTSAQTEYTNDPKWWKTDLDAKYFVDHIVIFNGGQNGMLRIKQGSTMIWKPSAADPLSASLKPLL